MVVKKATLLIADDDPAIRIPLYEVFLELGHSVRTAEDGVAALEEIDRQAPDILLSDLNMPRMSGFDLLTVVQRRFPAILTIAMSGTHSGEHLPPGVVADAFFQKGSSIHCLLRVMENLPTRKA